MPEADAKLKCLLAQRTNRALHRFEIFATGVLAFECFRNSACIVFVHATFVRFTFFAILFSAFCFRLLSAARIAATLGYRGLSPSVYRYKTPL
jgi:hypothetical protein